MEFNMLLGFLLILKKSIKIMPKNGRLMATVTSIYLIIASLLFVFNISTIVPMISDFFTKSVMLPSLDPQGPIFLQVLATIQKDVKDFLGVELAFILASFLISLIAQTAVILLAGVSYRDDIILPKDLFLRVPKSLTRIFITSFHVTLLRVGFLYFGFITTMVPTIMVSEQNHRSHKNVHLTEGISIPYKKNTYRCLYEGEAANRRVWRRRRGLTAALRRGVTTARSRSRGVTVTVTVTAAGRLWRQRQRVGEGVEWRRFLKIFVKKEDDVNERGRLLFVK